MALSKYFKQVDAKKPTKIGIVLLKPNGPLSSVMPSSTIESADVAVKKGYVDGFTCYCGITEGNEIEDYKGTRQDPRANSKPSTNDT